MSPDIASVLIRSCSFVLLFQCGGVVLFLGVFGGYLQPSRRPIQQVGFASALAATVLVSLHYGLEAARMGGEWASVFDPELQSLVLQTPTAPSGLLRLLSLLLIACSVRGTGTFFMLLGLAATALLTISFTLTGHTPQSAVPGLPVVLAVHLAAVAFWFGSLLPIMVVMSHEPAQRAAFIVQSFSRWALWTVAALFAAGVVLLACLLPGWSGLLTSYGLLVLAKIAAFGLLMGLAALNKWRYAPLLASQQSARQGLRRTVLAEYLVISSVLLLTALLTTFYSPDPG